MKTSLITATYNRALQLNRGIMTVIRQDVVPDEIIIVDDGSSDLTKQSVATLLIEATKKGIDLHYVYLNHPEPRISCIPHNVGIKKATGDLLIFTEPENLHVTNTIEQILQKATENPENVIVATQYWTMGQRIAQKLTSEEYQYPARILSHPYAMLVAGNMQNTKAPDADFGITGSNDCFTGAFFAAQKDWLLDVGGFDESFVGHGWDDWDLLHRLSLYGKPYKTYNDIVLIHQWHEKNYPYNIYDTAEKNGKVSEERIHKGEYRVNIGVEWGI